MMFVERPDMPALRALSVALCAAVVSFATVGCEPPKEPAKTPAPAHTPEPGVSHSAPAAASDAKPADATPAAAPEEKKEEK